MSEEEAGLERDCGQSPWCGSPLYFHYLQTACPIVICILAAFLPTLQSKEFLREHSSLSSSAPHQPTVQASHPRIGRLTSWSQQISNYKINLWNVLYLETKSQSRYLQSPYVFNYLNSLFYELSFNLRWLHVDQVSCNCPLTFSTENSGAKIWKNNSENFPGLVSVCSVGILYLCFVG